MGMGEIVGGNVKRGSRMKATDDELRASYAETGNVWKTAEKFGMCGQSVHERLTKLKAIIPMNVFTEGEVKILAADYSGHAAAGTLNDLARQLNRTKQFVCRQARALGLTDASRTKPYLSEGMSERATAWHKTNPHPKGMLGKKHGPAVKDAVSKASTARWAAMTDDERAAQTLKGMKTRASKGWAGNQKPHGSWKSAWREIGGQRCYFRSRWEANYARYLEWLKAGAHIKSWEHEPETFWFDKIKRGARSYLPDFRVTENSGATAFHEVKGWMDDRSKTKIRRMAKYHPGVKLIVIDAKSYKALAAKVSRLIKGWETENTAIPEAI